MRLAAGAVHDVVALAFAGIEPLALEHVAAVAGRPLCSASRIGSTVVFGSPRAAGTLPSTN